MMVPKIVLRELREEFGCGRCVLSTFRKPKARPCVIVSKRCRRKVDGH